MKFHFRKLENFHILLWLIKDLCWVADLKLMGMIMILPTLSLAIYITLINRNDKAELAHNLAVCLWICANSTWMIGEFFYEDTLRPYVKVFFALGLAIMLTYYLPLAIKQMTGSQNYFRKKT